MNGGNGEGKELIQTKQSLVRFVWIFSVISTVFAINLAIHSGYNVHCMYVYMLSFSIDFTIYLNNFPFFNVSLFSFKVLSIRFCVRYHIARIVTATKKNWNEKFSHELCVFSFQFRLECEKWALQKWIANKVNF